jgi:TPR repeat protein
MGDIYFVGEEDIEIDEARGVEYYIKAFNNGRRYDAFSLQGLYAYGTGNIKADIPKQISWLKRGIESNQTDCMVTMASICLSEDSVYKEYHNPQKGIELLKRAAKHGSGSAYYNIGNLYYRGEYISKDDKKAFENWQKAAELKSPDGGSNLAYAYIEGVGCDKDVSKGIEVYKQAVKNGSGFSANKLYYMYWIGTNGVNRDSELAKYYLLKAAELNDEWACFNLGIHYYGGDGLMRQDHDQAFIYVKKAADMGLVDACAALAYFYEEGIGCNKNPDKAKEYKDKTKAKSEKEE